MYSRAGWLCLAPNLVDIEILNFFTIHLQLELHLSIYRQHFDHFHNHKVILHRMQLQFRDSCIRLSTTSTHSPFVGIISQSYIAFTLLNDIANSGSEKNNTSEEIKRTIVFFFASKSCHIYQVSINISLLFRCECCFLFRSLIVHHISIRHASFGVTRMPVAITVCAVCCLFVPCVVILLCWPHCTL